MFIGQGDRKEVIMHKPHTNDQFKTLQYLKEQNFVSPQYLEIWVDLFHSIS